MGPGQVQRATVVRRKGINRRMSLNAQAEELLASGQTLVEVSAPAESRSLIKPDTCVCPSPTSASMQGDLLLP